MLGIQISRRPKPMSGISISLSSKGARIYSPAMQVPVSATVSHHPVASCELCDQIVAYAARERVPWPVRGLDRLVRIHVDLGGVKSGSLAMDGRWRLGR